MRRAFPGGHDAECHQLDLSRARRQRFGRCRRDGLVDDLLEPGSGWSIHKACDINDAGQIAGYAINTSTGLRAAVRLSPAGILPSRTAPGAPTLNGAVAGANSVRLARSAAPNSGSVITSHGVYRGIEPGGENLVTPVATVDNVLDYTKTLALNKDALSRDLQSASRFS